ncbi:hypothetical protein [Streptacidiphilus sp. EB103A]|uniref:hypothetical protein n=1 Tax=Streptacidiphilus sp. EB103A TaxID=3156275 RepID=UPI003511BADD
MIALLALAAVVLVIFVILGVSEHYFARAAETINGPAAGHPHPVRPPVSMGRHAAPRTGTEMPR